MNKDPLFSIIVVSYNAENYIGGTIESVLSQSFTDYEIVVKDAKSSDGTLANIPSDDRIRVYSTKDAGIYDGMNEAISYAAGRYLLFLNCGDSFHSNDVLQKVSEAILSDDDDRECIWYGDYYTKGMISRLPKNLSHNFLIRRPLCHQTMFFDRRLFESFGKYDLRFHILADYAFTLKVFNAGVRFSHMDIVIADYMGDGYSTLNPKVYQKEDSIIHEKFFTARERMLYKAQGAITLTALRKRITSNSSPLWIRKMYRKISNLLNS